MDSKSDWTAQKPDTASPDERVATAPPTREAVGEPEHGGDGSAAERQAAPAACGFPELEDQVRAALTAAAAAVIHPWLEANFGHAIQRHLAGSLQPLVNQLISVRMQNEVPAVVSAQIGAMEKRVGAAVTQKVGAAVEQALDPALSQQIVALESRMAVAIGDQVAKVLLHDVKPALSRQIADSRTDIEAALGQHVSAAVEHGVGPAVETRVSAAEIRLTSEIARQVRTEVAAVFRQIADAD
jgi:hypothetical protein